MAQPVRPEPKYFLQRAATEISLDDYEQRYFGGATDELVRGEKSTSYLEYPECARRIDETLPGVKLIVVLRDPVERAVSNYWFSVENGLEADPMEVAFRDEDERWQDYDRTRLSASPYAYVRRGRYVEYLAPYADVFGDRLRVVLLEDLSTSRERLREVFEFAGVETDFVPDVFTERVHSAERTGPETPSSVLALLRERFQESNAALTHAFDLDLSAWTS